MQPADILTLYLKKHPYLQQFASGTSCASMATHISGFSMVQKFQNLAELGHKSSPGSSA